MGGTTDPWNCIPVCAPCNLSKGSKHLLDWWDLVHTKEEEYKLEKIFVYILQELNKPRNYQISTIEQEKINKLIEEEQNIEEQDEESLLIETDKKLDTFTFLYQLINHLKQNKEYIKGNIDEYITELQQTYNNNTQYERLDIELFKVQNELVLYLKELGVTNHYSIAYSFAHQITSIEETKKNINEIKEYLNTDNISDILNKNPDILLMNIEYFSSRVEYIVNVLSIPLNILLDKPSLINQIESLRDLLEYCNSINNNFNDIPNYVFIRKKIKDIKSIIEVCKANGIKAEGNVFKQSADEITKIIDQTTPNMIQRISEIFERNHLIYGDV